LTFKTISPAPLSLTGRPRKITVAAREALRDFLDDNPGAYKDEMQLFLLEEFEIICSQSTISTTLASMKLSRKMQVKVLSEQDALLPLHQAVIDQADRTAHGEARQDYHFPSPRFALGRTAVVLERVGAEGLGYRPRHAIRWWWKCHHIRSLLCV
jgi:hypothetical protein